MVTLKIIQIFKIEADIMTLISNYCSKVEEKKLSKSSGGTKTLEPGARARIKTELPVSSSHGWLSSQKK